MYIGSNLIFIYHTCMRPSGISIERILYSSRLWAAATAAAAATTFRNLLITIRPPSERVVCPSTSVASAFFCGSLGLPQSGVRRPVHRPTLFFLSTLSPTTLPHLRVGLRFRRTIHAKNDFSATPPPCVCAYHRPRLCRIK